MRLLPSKLHSKSCRVQRIEAISDVRVASGVTLHREREAEVRVVAINVRPWTVSCAADGNRLSESAISSSAAHDAPPKNTELRLWRAIFSIFDGVLRLTPNPVNLKQRFDIVAVHCRKHTDYKEAEFKRGRALSEYPHGDVTRKGTAVRMVRQRS